VAASSGVVTTGVLPYQEILRLCGLGHNTIQESEGKGPIQPCRRKNVRSASYDLRLGKAYYFSEGEPKVDGSPPDFEVLHLEPGAKEHIVLAPNQFVVVSTLEKVCLPDDMVGHLTLKQDILLQGLIMGSQSQIDAGYSGWIYPLLYNLTNNEVTLQLRQSIIRLELVRLEKPTEKPYEGDYLNSSLSESLKEPIGSSLAVLRSEVSEARSRLSRIRLWGAIATAIALVIPVLLAWGSGLLGEVRDTGRAVSKLEGRFEGPVQPDVRVTRLEAQIDRLNCRVQKQEKPERPSKC
jgi:dCTP deaminase